MTKTSHQPIKLFQFPRMFGAPIEPILLQARDLVAHRPHPLRGREHFRSPQGAKGQAAVHRGRRRPHRRYLAHRGSLGADPRGRKQDFGAGRLQMCVQIINRLADGPKKIIVLVANQDLRDAASYWSEALGFAVDAARTGTHAAKLLQEGPYQATVTDRFVPPWPGLKAFRS